VASACAIPRTNAKPQRTSNVCSRPFNPLLLSGSRACTRAMGYTPTIPERFARVLSPDPPLKLGESSATYAEPGRRPSPAGTRPAESGATLTRVTSPRFFVARTIRAAKIVVQDGRIPRPVRWGGALGLAPVPGPFDEAVLLLVGGIVWLFYRDQLQEAWQWAERTSNSPSGSMQAGSGSG
jgi:hypothetical protein